MTQLLMDTVELVLLRREISEAHRLLDRALGQLVREGQSAESWDLASDISSWLSHHE